MGEMVMTEIPIVDVEAVLAVRGGFTVVVGYRIADGRISPTMELALAAYHKEERKRGENS